FGVRVEGERVRMRSNNTPGCYRGLRDCPFVEPANAGPRLFANLRPGVATNLPSYLTIAEAENGRALNTLAEFPPRSVRVSVRGGEFGRITPFPFAAGGEWGEGRVLVLSDHSVFINDMMLQGDNSNIDFTYNCLEWLRDGPEKRTHVLFVDEGSVVRD